MLNVEALPTIEEDEFDLDVQLLPAIASQLNSMIIAGSGNTCNTAQNCPSCQFSCQETCGGTCNCPSDSCIC